MTESERNDNRRIAEALGWTHRDGIGWLQPFMSHHVENVPDFHTDPAAALDAAVNIVGDFGIAYENKVWIVFPREGVRTMPLAARSATLCPPLVAMMIAVLDEVDKPSRSG